MSGSEVGTAAGALYASAALALALMIVVAAVVAARSRRVSEDSAVDVVRRFVAAAAQGDYRRARRCCAPGCLTRVLDSADSYLPCADECGLGSATTATSPALARLLLDSLDADDVHAESRLHGGVLVSVGQARSSRRTRFLVTSHGSAR